MNRVGMVIVAAVVFVVASGCASLAQAPASTPTPSEAQRRECERNGGYWSTAAGFCRIGQ